MTSIYVLDVHSKLPLKTLERYCPTQKESTVGSRYDALILSNAGTRVALL